MAGRGQRCDAVEVCGGGADRGRRALAADGHYVARSLGCRRLCSPGAVAGCGHVPAADRVGTGKEGLERKDRKGETGKRRGTESLIGCSSGWGSPVGKPLIPPVGVRARVTPEQGDRSYRPRFMPRQCPRKPADLMSMILSVQMRRRLSSGWPNSRRRVPLFSSGVYVGAQWWGEEVARLSAPGRCQVMDAHRRCPFGGL